MLTELDKAVIKANENPETNGNRFYDLFLNSIIYVPTWDVPEEVGETVLKENEALYPIVIEDEDLKYVMLFDTQERVNHWVESSEEPREIGFVGLKGYEVLKYFGNGVHMMLNVVSDYMKEFTPEEIEWLLSSTSMESQ